MRDNLVGALEDGSRLALRVAPRHRVRVAGDERLAVHEAGEAVEAAALIGVDVTCPVLDDEQVGEARHGGREQVLSRLPDQPPVAVQE